MHPFPDGALTHAHVVRDLVSDLPRGQEPVYDEGSPDGRQPPCILCMFNGPWWLPVDVLDNPSLALLHLSEQPPDQLHLRRVARWAGSHASQEARRPSIEAPVAT